MQSPTALRPPLAVPGVSLRLALARKGLPRKVSKRQCWSECDAGTNVVACHRRIHIIPNCIEALDWPVILGQDFTMGSGHEAPARSEVAGLQLDRIEGRLLDRAEAGVGHMGRIAFVGVIGRRALAEIVIDASLGKPSDTFDRAL